MTLAAGLSSPAFLAVDAQFVYWLDEGTYGGMDGAVKKVPICGGAVVTLVASLPSPGAMATDATDVYWANGTGAARALLKVAKTGGAVTTLTTEADATALAVGGGYAYWASLNAMGILFRVPIAGGAPEVLVPGSSFGGGVFLDGSSVYFTNEAYTTGAVLSAPADPASGGGVVTLASMRNQPRSVIAQGSLVYWTEAADDTGYLGNVMAVPSAGGAFLTIAAGEINPQALAVDASYVYWTNESDVSIGNVTKAPLGGGPIAVVAAYQSYPGSVAVDDSYVYWTTGEATGSIVRLPK